MGAILDLRSDVAAVPIERDVVAVEGPEAISFLQGQLSQDVESLGIWASAWSLLLQPTGKVDAWLRVTRTGDEQLVLDVDPGYGEAVLARLRRFKLRTKADLGLDRLSGLALRGPGAWAADVDSPGRITMRAGWPGIDGFDLLSGDPIVLDGVPVVDGAALEALRIECGVPAMGAELTEATIPAEAGQWLIQASVSFTKGCYTGQELVARIDSRGGNVPRPVRGLLVEGDPVPVGSAVRHGGTVVGAVTSSARSAVLGAIALAPIGRAVEPGADLDVELPDGSPRSATLADLPLR